MDFCSSPLNFWDAILGCQVANCFEAPGVALGGGSSVSIGGVRILRVPLFSQLLLFLYFVCDHATFFHNTKCLFVHLVCVCFKKMKPNIKQHNEHK